MVVDQPSVNNRVRQWGRELLGASSSRLQENSLFDVVDSIRKAKDDKNITGMVLQLNDFVGADQPSLRYIGKALREFRDSGKPIFAIGDSYNQTQYFRQLRQQGLSVAAGRGRSARFRHQQPVLQVVAGHAQGHHQYLPRRHL